MYICLRALLAPSTRGKLREGAYGMAQSLFAEAESRSDAPAFGRVYGTLLGAAIDAREFEDCKRIIVRGRVPRGVLGLSLSGPASPLTPRHALWQRFLDRHELLLPQFARIRLLWLSARDHSLWDLAREEHGGDDVPLSHPMSESALATVSEYWPDDCVEWSAWGVHVIAQLRRNNAVRLLERRTVAQYVADSMVLEHHGLEEVAVRARNVAEHVSALRGEGRTVSLGDALLMRRRVPMDDLERQSVGELAYTVLRTLGWDPTWQARGGAFAHAVTHRGDLTLEELAKEVLDEGAAAVAAQVKRAKEAERMPPVRTWRDLDALQGRAGSSASSEYGAGDGVGSAAAQVEDQYPAAGVPAVDVEGGGEEEEGEIVVADEAGEGGGTPGDDGAVARPLFHSADSEAHSEPRPRWRGALGGDDEPGVPSGVEEYNEDLFQPVSDVHEELVASHQAAGDVAGRVEESETALLSSEEEEEEGPGVAVAKAKGGGPEKGAQ